jgi:hypothetical protein
MGSHNEALIRAQSISKNGLVTTTYADDGMVKGQCFHIRKRLTLTSGQTYYVAFDLTANDDKILFSLPLEMSTAGGCVFVDTYGADSYTGGTSITPIKMNAMGTQNALAVVKEGVTPTGGPYSLREYIVGTLSTNQSSGSGTGLIDTPKILNPAKPIIFKLVNQESSSVILNINFIWYEI